jgi:hypothetical protein
MGERPIGHDIIPPAGIDDVNEVADMDQGKAATWLGQYWTANHIAPEAQEQALGIFRLAAETPLLRVAVPVEGMWPEVIDVHAAVQIATGDHTIAAALLARALGFPVEATFTHAEEQGLCVLYCTYCPRARTEVAC